MFRGAQYFLTVEIDQNSPYQADLLDDSLLRWNAFLQDKARQGEIREVSSRPLQNVGLTAKIYQKAAR